MRRADKRRVVPRLAATAGFVAIASLFVGLAGSAEVRGGEPGEQELEVGRDPVIPESDGIVQVENPLAGAALAPAHETLEQSSPREKAAVRCRVKLDVLGELTAPAGRGQPPLRRPIELGARFDFEERPTPAADAVSRVYTDAVASLRVGDDTRVTSLAADARRVLVVKQGAAAEPCLADGFLTGDERDLLSTPFDGMLIDDMLPTAAVADRETWDIPADLMAGLLAIDTVESGRIEARLEEVADGRGRVSFSGRVEGGVDGVPTRVEVAGSLFAPAREIEEAVAGDAGADDQPAVGSGPLVRRHELRRPLEQLSVTLRERRQAGHVAPGFDVEARMVIARAAVAGEARPAPAVAAVASHPRRRDGGGPGRVWRRDAEGRFDLVHDSRWRVVEEGQAGLVMRLVDHGALVGQCSIVASPGSGIEPPTIADVRRDIERSLAGQMDRVDDATAYDRADGAHVVRVASSGTAERLPFSWIHYAVALPHGGRIDVTFMVQESMRPRFAEADQELVAALAAAPAGGARPGESGKPAGPDVVREARAAAASPSAGAQ